MNASVVSVVSDVLLPSVVRHSRRQSRTRDKVGRGSRPGSRLLLLRYKHEAGCGQMSEGAVDHAEKRGGQIRSRKSRPSASLQARLGLRPGVARSG